MSGPRVLDFRGFTANDEDLAPVVEHLREGGLIAYPTETVYGFGCLLQEGALAQLSTLKSRDAGRPFLLLVPGAGALERLAWTPDARELAEVFWPGALTLVLADPEGAYPARVRSDAGAVAARVSGHPLARRLVDLLGEPLTSTSANRPGEAPAASGEEALAAARALGAAEEMWVLDAGALPASAPSTIVDCTEDTPRVIRAGVTPVGRLRCVLPHFDPKERRAHGA